MSQRCTQPDTEERYFGVDVKPHRYGGPTRNIENVSQIMHSYNRLKNWVKFLGHLPPGEVSNSTYSPHR